MTESADSLETYPIETLALFKWKAIDDGKQFTSGINQGNAVKAAAESTLRSEITILSLWISAYKNN